MSISAFAARRRGFTLIELLIVIVVIAILALIVIPRVMGASRKAKEATLKGNLHEIRNALEQFQADTGGYPTTANLIDIVAPSEAKLQSTNLVDEYGDAVNEVTGTYKGPYLTTQGGIDNTGIPENPFEVPTGTPATDFTNAWNYTAAVGENDGTCGTIHCSALVIGSTLGDNIPYQSL